ncbi:hypothetical protein GCM10023195_50580 [Actinoallomurus liliacearum]|uniref:DUF5753 domain-containing protein n=1 Tax=Actinoallomurus liliacearum TaxID=1080073 RepID=A0ABP8TPL9_9ACTN
MRREDRESGALRRIMRYLQAGMMLMGAYAWPSPEAYFALRAAAARQEPHRPPGRPHPERITSYADLSPAERRLLTELEEQLDRESEK